MDIGYRVAGILSRYGRGREDRKQGVAHTRVVPPEHRYRWLPPLRLVQSRTRAH
jgi:hypothetical protein